MNKWLGNQTDPAGVWIKGCTEWVREELSPNLGDGRVRRQRVELAI